MTLDLPPGTPVRQEYTKYDGSPHWTFDTVLIGQDGHGCWLGGRPGDVFRRPGRRIEATAHYVTCIPQDDWYVATFNDEGADLTAQIYIDLCTPAQWLPAGRAGEPVTLRSADLDLDVVRRFSGLCLIEDEDEFAEHQLGFGYPPELVQTVRRTADTLLADVVAGHEPYGRVGFDWLRRCREHFAR